MTNEGNTIGSQMTDRDISIGGHMTNEDNIIKRQMTVEDIKI